MGCEDLPMFLESGAVSHVCIYIKGTGEHEGEIKTASIATTLPARIPDLGIWVDGVITFLWW